MKLIRSSLWILWARHQPTGPGQSAGYRHLLSILGDLVQQVGGDQVSVSTLVGPNGDAHVYQPTPQDIRTLANSKLLVSNGLSFPRAGCERSRHRLRFQGGQGSGQPRHPAPSDAGRRSGTPG